MLVSFEIEFEGGIGVDRSKMRIGEGIPNRETNMPKTTRGESYTLTRGWERRLREAERS